MPNMCDERSDSSMIQRDGNNEDENSGTLTGVSAMQSAKR